MPLLVAHRGESYLAPENTLAAFDLAWQLGATAIETDVHLTADGRAICCHDADTFRTSGNLVRKIIRQSTLAELQQVDVGRWKGEQFVGQVCPTFRDVLGRLPAGTVCFCELKSGADLLPAVVEDIAATRTQHSQIVIISFHDDAIMAARRALPNCQHHLLIDPTELPASIEDCISRAKSVNANGLDLKACPLLDESSVRTVLAAGLELHVWTVDDPAIARRYAKLGVQSITSNRRRWLQEQFESTRGV